MFLKHLIQFYIREIFESILVSPSFLRLVLTVRQTAFNTDVPVILVGCLSFLYPLINKFSWCNVHGVTANNVTTQAQKTKNVMMHSSPPKPQFSVISNSHVLPSTIPRQWHTLLSYIHNNDDDYNDNDKVPIITFPKFAYRKWNFGPCTPKPTLWRKYNKV